MAKPKKKSSGSKKGKITIKQGARLKKKDEKPKADTTGLKKAPIRLSGDNGANFRIKIRKK